jgi:hypothetical protein
LPTLDTERSEQTPDDNGADAKSACVALVAVATRAQWSEPPALRWSRPDSMFVTHLIATAAQDPQTRSLRRGSFAEAQTAYGAKPNPASNVGRRTRQTI